MAGNNLKSVKFCWVGASWAVKGYTEQNYKIQENLPQEGDCRVPDFWDMPFVPCCMPGHSSLDLLDKLKSQDIDPNLPIIWVYGEPGRDYGRITGDSAHNWLAREDCFEIRKHLNEKIMETLRNTLPNPIALIGGDTDIDLALAEKYQLHVLCGSWQKWIAEKLNSKWFKFGWGASDAGWRMNADNVKLSRSVVLAWDELIKEWCFWEDHGYFCHEHPTPKCHKEFAEYLQPKVQQWLEDLS
jgi:hypothetical protein